MSKIFTGTTTNNVTELTLQNEGSNIGTPTIVWGDTQGTIDQVLGDIPDSWKYNDPSLKQIQIGSSCTAIGDSGLRANINVTGSLVIPDSVTSIGFYGCGALYGLDGTLTIGSGLTVLEQYVFFGLNMTSQLTIPNNITSIKFAAFRSCDFTGPLVIPDSVLDIGQDAFLMCYGFNTLTIGNSVTSIGHGAFELCNNITRIEIYAPTPPTIGTLAFNRMFALSPAEVHVPSGTKAAYEAAYDWANNNPAITVVDDL